MTPEAVPPSPSRKSSAKPIVFASTGEKLADFSLFHPERMADRILGMGDVLTLIEKAEEHFDQDSAEKAATALMEGTFTLEDFLEQMQSVKKMGNLKNLVAMLPGMPKEIRDVEIEDKETPQGRGDHPLDDA